MRTLRALLDAPLGHETLWPRFSSPDTKQPREQYPCKCSLFELSRNNGEEQALLGQFVQCIFRCPTHESRLKSVCSSPVTMKGAWRTVFHADSYVIQIGKMNCAFLTWGKGRKQNSTPSGYTEVRTPSKCSVLPSPLG